MLPQALTLYLTALYNFAITGSVRPDALFLAWGPGGVSSARVGQGLLGLWLDARYGIVPYVPFLLLAAGGVMLPAARRLAWAVPAALVYYVTVASADNWSGAIVQPRPLHHAGHPARARVRGADPGATRGKESGRWRSRWRAGRRCSRACSGRTRTPPTTARCCWRAASSRTATSTCPNLFLRSWGDAAPGLWARVLAWLILAAVIAWWVRKAAAREAASAARSLFGGAAIVLCLAAVLERWPSARTRPLWNDALALSDGGTVHFLDGVAVRDESARPRPGTVELLVRTRDPRDAIALTAEGDGVIRVAGSAPIVVSGRPMPLNVPLAPLRRLTGRRGVEESLSRQDLRVEGSLVLRVTP